MSQYRVTKYDPKLRGDTGAFLGDDWTAFSDIGKAFGGRVLSLAEYLETEEAYVESVRRFMRAADVSCLSVVDLEQPRSERHTGLGSWAHYLKEGAQLSGSELWTAIRLCLRECVWFRLEAERGFYVHFGYDYYLYVGSQTAPLVAPALPEGMFAEPFVSPYWPEPETDEGA